MGKVLVQAEKWRKKKNRTYGLSEIGLHIQRRVEMNSNVLKKRPKKDSKSRKHKKHFGQIQKL